MSGCADTFGVYEGSDRYFSIFGYLDAARETQAELRRIVRHERTVELAFEGLRVFDIRRWGMAEECWRGR